MIAQYPERELRQQGLDELHTHDELDPRSAFNHDRDRILYSRGFAALAGKTQVVASDEAGSYHTRLTHSLKVEQVGRRITEMLNHRSERPGPDPDLVSAACLAHDIGHPPFGHAGETALHATYCKLQKELAKEAPSPDTPSESEGGDAAGPGSDEPGDVCDGFEGNAQNLRILSYLEARKTQNHKGLHLTRATLHATIKYPWFRDPTYSGDGPDRGRKFGFYRDDQAVADWIYDEGVPTRRPVEEQIMDWADDVTYACHDMEDFYRAKMIPLGDLLYFPSGAWSRLPPDQQASPELARFLNYVEKKWIKDGKPFDRGEAVEAMKKLADVLRPVIAPYLGEHDDKRLLTTAVSGLIRYLLEGLRFEPVDPDNDQGPLNSYHAELFVPPDRKHQCNLLKELIWFYVIHNPALTSQQNGSNRMVSDLLTWHVEQPEYLLPPDRREELDRLGQPVLRVCCDYVASLTERQATMLYHRMAGISLGSVTDRLHL